MTYLAKNNLLEKPSFRSAEVTFFPVFSYTQY